MDSASPLACELHRTHSPANLTVELHHIVPVAWQLLWQPPTPPYPGHDPDGRGLLWDARTVVCCPTGHRNVHALIVRLMHALAGEDPVQAIHAISARRSSQLTTAAEALARFKEASGTLQTLVAAHQWGES